jgi:hypothetical protein
MSTQPTKENNDGNGMSYSKVWAEALRRVKEREDEVAQLIKKREEERREAEEERRWEEDFNRRLRCSVLLPPSPPWRIGVFLLAARITA